MRDETVNSTTLKASFLDVGGAAGVEQIRTQLRQDMANDLVAEYTQGLRTRLGAQVNRAVVERLKAAGYGPITTEIKPAEPFYFAEGYHQQYLAKNPAGYCGVGGTGVSCPIGLKV